MLILIIYADCLEDDGVFEDKKLKQATAFSVTNNWILTSLV
jgi:hypothetical protein